MARAADLSSRFFVAALAGCAALLVGAAWLLQDRIAAARETATALELKRREADSLRLAQPRLTRANAEAIVTELAETRSVLATMRAALRGGAAAQAIREAAAPTSRADAFFDLAGFVERGRERAQQHGVEIRPEAARFGFSAHANVGPEEPEIAAVFQQRQIIERLLEPLFDARPQAVVSVRRERPVSRKEASTATEISSLTTRRSDPRGRDNNGTDDFFALDPRLSLRLPGVIDAMAFQLTFVGETATLRGFLDRLARSELPVVARELAVETATANREGRRIVSGARSRAPLPASFVLDSDTAAANSSGPAPLIPRTFSTFTVTVEFLELAATPEQRVARL